MEIENNDVFPKLLAIDYHIYFKEQLVFLYYHSVRSTNSHLSILERWFENVLSTLKSQMKLDPISYKPYVSRFYQLLCYIRDIQYGKGEHDLTYMMIHVWYKYYPIPTIYFIHQVVRSLGSWRDIKYLCDYLRRNSKAGNNHPLIETCIQLMNRSLSIDSSCVKWVPREGKRFTWLNEQLAIHWVKTYRPICRSIADDIATVNSYKREYRRFIKKQRAIDSFSPILSKTLKDSLYKYAYRASQLLTHNFESINSDTLNADWARFVKYLHIGKLKDIIPIIDFASLDMLKHEAKQTYFLFLGMACLLAEHSSYGKRILLVGEKYPIWVNLELCDGFVSMIQSIENAVSGLHSPAFGFILTVHRGERRPSNTIWLDAIRLLINSFRETNTSPHHIENMTLILLSCCGFSPVFTEKTKNNIDGNGESLHKETFLDAIEELFFSMSRKISFRRPRIIFYKQFNNDIQELPCSIDDKGITLFSGCVSSLLSHIRLTSSLTYREQYIHLTAYETIQNMINKPRYTFVFPIREPTVPL